MLALTLIDKALSDHGIPGGPVIWCHDEIVLEVPEEAAEKAAELLEEAMTLAFVTIFPDAPIYAWRPPSRAVVGGREMRTGKRKAKISPALTPTQIGKGTIHNR